MADFWKLASAAPIGAADTKTLTFGFFANIHSNDTGNLIGQYVSGGVTRVNIELLNASPNRFRVTLRDISGATIAFFSSPGFSSLYNQNAMYLMTVDMAAADVASGVKVYGNGSDLGPSVSGGTWVQGATIGWTWSGTASAGFNLANITGKVGMAFLDRGFVDITDADVRDQFSGHRIGVNGENIMGRLPDHFLCGVVSDWMNVGGINRGTGPKHIAQSGTSITLDSGGAQSWPAAPFADALVDLAGPNGQVDDARDYTVSLNGALANPLAVSLSDGGAGGVFTPTSLTFDPATGPTTLGFSYEPAAATPTTLTASATGVTTAELDIAVEQAPATTYTLTGEASTTVATPVVLTLELAGGNPLGVTVDFALSGVSGTFSVNPALIEIGQTTTVVTFTPSSVGTATITPTNGEGLTDPAPLAIVVTGATSAATRGSLRRLGIWI